MLLKKFKSEVTDQGPEACLPCNLPDDWLGLVQTSTDAMLEGDGTGKGSIAMAAVLLILQEKSGDEGSSFSLDEMYKHFQDYRIELALEEVHRKTEVKYEAATLATIFTNRDVKTWRAGPS